MTSRERGRGLRSRLQAPLVAPRTPVPGHAISFFQTLKLADFPRVCALKTISKVLSAKARSSPYYMSRHTPPVHETRLLSLERPERRRFVAALVSGPQRRRRRRAAGGRARRGGRGRRRGRLRYLQLVVGRLEREVGQQLGELLLEERVGAVPGWSNAAKSVSLLGPEANATTSGWGLR